VHFFSPFRLDTVYRILTVPAVTFLLRGLLDLRLLLVSGLAIR